MSSVLLEAELTATIDTMNHALVAKDIPTLEKIFAEGYIFTTPIGTTLDKSQRLDSVQSGKRQISSLEFADLKLQFYGTTAVATSVYSEVVEPQHITQQGRITNIFVHIDGRWQMVAGQSYSAAATQSAQPAKPA